MAKKAKKPARPANGRKPCSRCGKAQGTRAGGLCNACSTAALSEGERVVMKPVDWLRPHPLNQGIYRDGVDEAFVASVKAVGIRTPIIATPEGVMASGHRRREAARIACLAEVPVIIRQFADDDALLEELIANNAQRSKTNEQIGREARIIETIHGRRPNGEGKWRDRAGELLGVSGFTAQKACEAVKAMDRREALGDREGAQRIREALAQSVHRGYEEAKGRATPASKPAQEPPAVPSTPDDEKALAEIDGQGDPRVMPEGFPAVVEPSEGAAPTGTVVPPVVEPPPEGDSPDDDGDEGGENPPEPAPEAKPRKPERYGPPTAEDEAEPPVELPKTCPQGCPLATRQEAYPFYMAQELFPPMIAAIREAQATVSEMFGHEAPGLERLMAYAERKIGRKPEGHPRGAPAPMVHYLAELDNALRKVKAHRPACRWCPSCALRGKPNDKECMRCHGLGYVTQAVWEEATDAGRAAALARGAAHKGAA